MLRPLRVINLTSSLTRYLAGLSLQESVVEERKKGLIGDTLILLQHYPVYTLGKRGKPSDFRTSQKDLEATGAEICSVSRGGEVTFHGPGQLVAYPIVGVRQAGLGARAYVESLEDSIIDCLANYGIAARGRVPGATGVWVGERKIAAIGVRISHGVSSHGLALNIDTDLSYFQHIVPCGIPDKEVTSVRLELRELQGLKGQSLPPPGAVGGGAVGGGAGAGAALQGEAAGAGGRGAALGGATGADPDFARVVEDFTSSFRARLGFAAGY
ncbi:hypothetical protein PLESTB_001982300 [Pleodorina starrii]|uniref:lipoyl(octanoyl) transferase n=1 Tax=Pleodorina starrii TaxID=330485 RepID=A0A9W6C4Z7_9CHLO|nr:hypothetical protein PLESTM_001057100 [Pleodorina starrii]GLC63115.1 hypothetical protein PLESTB_001982300 [Pleodorina starrii]GLC77656.1 hypothetical protein PLESTF_001968800 [Pleodorina starrii]